MYYSVYIIYITVYILISYYYLYFMKLIQKTWSRSQILQKLVKRNLLLKKMSNFSRKNSFCCKFSASSNNYFISLLSSIDIQLSLHELLIFRISVSLLHTKVKFLV